MLPEKLEVYRNKIQKDFDAAVALSPGTIITGWPGCLRPGYKGELSYRVSVEKRSTNFPPKPTTVLRFKDADSIGFEVYAGTSVDDIWDRFAAIREGWSWYYLNEDAPVIEEPIPTTKLGYEIVLTGMRKTIGMSSWCLDEMTNIYPTDYLKPSVTLKTVSEKYNALKEFVSLCRKNKKYVHDENGGEYRNTRSIWREGKYAPDDCDGFFAVIYRDAIESGIKPEEVYVCADVRRLGEGWGHSMAAVAIPGDFLIADGTGAHFQQEVVLLSEVIDRFQPFVIASHEGGGYPELRAIELEPVVASIIDPYSTTPPIVPAEFRVSDLIPAASSRTFRFDNNPAYPYEYKGADNMRRMRYDIASCYLLVFWKLREQFENRNQLVLGDAAWDKTGGCKHDLHNSAEPNLLDIDYPLLVPGYVNYYPMTHIWRDGVLVYVYYPMTHIWSDGNLGGYGNLLLDVIDIERIYWLCRYLRDLMSIQISMDDRILTALQVWAANNKLPKLEYVTGDSHDGPETRYYNHHLHMHCVGKKIKYDSIITWSS